MSVVENITREGLSLKRILCNALEEYENSKVYAFEEIIFEFEKGFRFSIKVDIDTDEIIVGESGEIKSGMIDITCLYPSFIRFYGCTLMWSWEMKNHQGYLDALQLEFWNKDFKEDRIVQLKAISSSIYIFTVNQL